MIKLPSSIGGAPFSPTSVKAIRLLRKGCANRPFFHISIMEAIKPTTDPVIEQIGSYDPLPNKYNEKLVAINFQRLNYWIKEGAIVSKSVKKLLGLAGYFPVHPASFQEAWENRKLILERLERLQAEVAKIEATKINTPDAPGLDSSEGTSDQSEPSDKS
ncbi:hypothetical protein RUM44_011240 [Polyplax serrata]|uniref:Small ribosomal subunit protein bS16m n=1 Tax=Polyplax serrata TaxID=468196 RepID=A0ABR1APH3_POLSC